MNALRYLYRYLRNSILKAIALIFGENLEALDDILIISPHPDDEILGCGGLLSYMVKQHKTISIVFMTKGENVNKKISPEVLKVERAKLTKRVLANIGQSLDRVYFLDFSDGGVNIKDAETEKLNALIDRINPRAIFVTHRLEGWNDHVQSNYIIRKLIQNRPIKLYEYCVWFWYTMPFPKVFTIKWHDARYFKMGKDTHKLKKEAIKIYMDETNAEGLPYSGALPPVLLTSCSWREEIFFESKPDFVEM